MPPPGSLPRGPRRSSPTPKPRADWSIQALIACLGPARDEEDVVAKRRHALVMRRFHAAVAASGDRPIYVSDLCAAIGVSDRTLQICCREHLGMGPRKYLWLRRMQEVRHALALAEQTRATVTEVATSHGFWELGRFAGAYRALYGESPSATLRRTPDGAYSRRDSTFRPSASETA
jgi:transcriptional regulator GlxA family with amidase domain